MKSDSNLLSLFSMYWASFRTQKGKARGRLKLCQQCWFVSWIDGATSVSHSDVTHERIVDPAFRLARMRFPLDGETRFLFEK